MIWEIKDLDAFLAKKQSYSKWGSAKLEKYLKDHNVKLKGSITQKDLKSSLNQAYKASRYYKQVPKQTTKPLNIMVYDLETSQVDARLWNTGQQYVGHKALTSETRIVTVAWKWLGSDEVFTLKWSMKKKSDKKLMTKFVEEYNKADMVIGYNNNSFDNKLVVARAIKYNLDVNTLVKSFDVMRKLKKVARLPSFSMAYVAKFLGLGSKLQHTGIKMWDDIQYGHIDDAKQSMKLMLKYNIQDIILTEEIYYRLRKYLPHTIHIGALQGLPATTSPYTGSTNVKLHSTTTTPAGTIQRVMKCKDTKALFKVSNSNYLKTTI